MERNEFGVSKDQMIRYMIRKKEEILDVEKSLQENKFDTLENFGHKLKGNAEVFGHKTLGSYGSELEQFAKKNDKQKTKEIFDKIKEYINKCE